MRKYSDLFNGCKSLISIPDISNWKTHKIVGMNHIFDGCSSLISMPDITKWDISNAININNMFSKMLFFNINA